MVNFFDMHLVAMDLLEVGSLVVGSVVSPIVIGLIVVILVIVDSLVVRNVLSSKLADSLFVSPVAADLIKHGFCGNSFSSCWFRSRQ